MSPNQLAQCTGATPERAARWLEPISEAMALWEIDTPKRQAAFLSQIGHESQGLRFTAEIWGPTDAQKRYENRLDLGNIQQGDGYRYRGRGLIQITGRLNYQACQDGIGINCIATPDLLEATQCAALSAAWWWHAHGCNALADAGNVMALTRRINGGINGLAERTSLYVKASAALGV